MITNSILRRVYQETLYDNFSNDTLHKLHTEGKIVASLSLWNKGLLNAQTILLKYGCECFVNRARGAYAVVNERGY